MRFELAGSLTHYDPIVLTFTEDQDFSKEEYVELGYTHFDVICIGGGGGAGGSIDTGNTDTQIRNYGGAGGGGGFHRIKGLLSGLPDTCPIVVGVGGAAGTDHISSPGLVTDGEDAGFSSFNGSVCRASGGKGGKRVQSNSSTVGAVANGGEGGLGDRGAAGGGAAGGTAGTPSDDGSSAILGVDGVDGMLLNDNIGEGGGGGAGGVGKYGSGGITCLPGTTGGRGAYNPADTSVFGAGSTATEDQNSGADFIVPGFAGGAKASPLNGLPTIYGQSTSQDAGNSGVVILRISRE